MDFKSSAFLGKFKTYKIFSCVVGDKRMWDDILFFFFIIDTKQTYENLQFVRKTRQYSKLVGFFCPTWRKLYAITVGFWMQGTNMKHKQHGSFGKVPIQVNRSPELKKMQIHYATGSAFHITKRSICLTVFCALWPFCIFWFKTFTNYCKLKDSVLSVACVSHVCRYQAPSCIFQKLFYKITCMKKTFLTFLYKNELLLVCLF